MAKVQISIDGDLLKRLDDYANRSGLTRSGVVTHSVVQFLDTVDCLNAMKTVSVSLQRIAASGTVSDADMKSLREFEILSSAVLGQRV